MASGDPVGFVNQYPEGLLVIDEVQRVPEIVIAVKEAVDRDKRPGRFLLTGSANLLELAATHESLAGRAETQVLYPLSLTELKASPGAFVDALVEGPRLRRYTSELTRDDYLDLACSGGHPEALTRVAVALTGHSDGSTPDAGPPPPRGGVKLQVESIFLDAARILGAGEFSAFST